MNETYDCKTSRCFYVANNIWEVLKKYVEGDTNAQKKAQMMCFSQSENSTMRKLFNLAFAIPPNENGRKAYQAAVNRNFAIGKNMLNKLITVSEEKEEDDAWMEYVENMRCVQAELNKEYPDYKDITLRITLSLSEAVEDDSKEIKRRKEAVLA